MLYLMFLLMANGDTTNMSGFSSKLWMNTPSLSSVSLGYSNPMLSTGLTGALCNPAGLWDIKGTEVSGVFAIGTSSKLAWAPVIPVGDDTTKKEYIKMNLDMSFASPMGVNLIGAGMKKGRIAFALGFMDGFGTGLSVRGNSKMTYDFNDSIMDTLTHSNISEIPDDGTEIPVKWILNTSLTPSLDADANFGYYERNLFMGMATGFGALKLGFGVAYRPISGKLSYDATANVNAPCSLTCIPQFTTSDWTTDVNGHSVMNQDLFSADGELSLSGKEFSYITGLQFKFLFFNIGASVTMVPGTVLTVDGSSASMNVNGSSKISSISYSPGDIVIDTATHTVSGTVGLGLSKMPDTTQSDSIKETYRIPAQTSVNLGSYSKLGPITFSSSIGATFCPLTFSDPDSSDSTKRMKIPVSGFCGSLGFESRIGFPLRISLNGKTYFFEGTAKDSSSTYFPKGGISTTLDIGTTFSVKKTSVSVGLRTNPIAVAGLFANLFPAPGSGGDDGDDGDEPDNYGDGSGDNNGDKKGMKDWAAENGYPFPSFFSSITPVIGISRQF
ncbi:MAG: hypothetical protein PHX21_11130 [bacterium]|nr:hypothetical protein [bacterium]